MQRDAYSVDTNISGDSSSQVTGHESASEGTSHVCSAPDDFGPRRVQLSRAKGWRMPPNTVRVARPSRWGNPYRLDKGDGVAEAREAVDLYRSDLYRGRWRITVDLARAELAGKNLACWCPPDMPCHVDVLLEAANSEPDPPDVSRVALADVLAVALDDVGIVYDARVVAKIADRMLELLELLGYTIEAAAMTAGLCKTCA